MCSVGQFQQFHHSSQHTRAEQVAISGILYVFPQLTEHTDSCPAILSILQQFLCRIASNVHRKQRARKQHHIAKRKNRNVHFLHLWLIGLQITSVEIRNHRYGIAVIRVYENIIKIFLHCLLTVKLIKMVLKSKCILVILREFYIALLSIQSRTQKHRRKFFAKLRKKNEIIVAFSIFKFHSEDFARFFSFDFCSSS